MRAERTIGTIFRRYFADYANTHALAYHQYRAGRMISRCGRPEMGGHIERCECGETERIVWHSCHHRSCARCAKPARERWLEKERARLLPCGHHHIVFTIPHELLHAWRYNREWMTDALFAAASETLKQLLADPKYLGAVPGMLLSVHTWSRATALHPHIHALVTDGGLKGEEWVKPRRSHFLPGRVVMTLFRGKFLASVRSGLDEGAVVVPRGRSEAQVRSLLNRLGRTKWHVWLCGRYEHGKGVLTYLARYVRGGPTNNSQIVAADDDGIVVSYRPHGGEMSYLRLTPEAWLGRFLEHVPIKGQHGLRHYGLYASGARPQLERARHLVAPEEAPLAKPSTAVCQWSPVLCCPSCQGPLRNVGRIGPVRAPP